MRRQSRTQSRWHESTLSNGWRRSYAGRRTSARCVERNRKYRWSQCLHRNGLMRKSAHISLSITPLFRDLRTDLLWHLGQMLLSPKPKLISPAFICARGRYSTSGLCRRQYPECRIGRQRKLWTLCTTCGIVRHVGSTQAHKFFPSYYIPANPAVSCSYALFCATAPTYLLFPQ